MAPSQPRVCIIEKEVVPFPPFIGVTRPRKQKKLMTKKLLIDATHPEETRVVAYDDGKIVGFEIESSAKQRIIGNIYLARVVRIEAALQSVFVDYGGNRHGFLTFNEIHRDYYKIPVGDQQSPGDNARRSAQNGPLDEAGFPSTDENADSHLEPLDDPAETDTTPATPRRQYRVQDVIRKGQILLVQVTKSERDNKGAALTTYISLAGRYCVLMPNSDRGGGISRKITDLNERRKLKKIVSDISVMPGTGLIIRTAGVGRTKPEIRRDFGYLIRQWNEIRELTLKSIAPSKIYEEGNLIRRAIRDDYTKDMTEVLVQGDLGYKSAKTFMKMIMPSHAKKVKPYQLAAPIFSHFGVEEKVENLHNPVVQLKSGGYIVIDRTEALIAIDVNSGRANRQGTLEQTAVKTNLEAAETVAEQIRLRDLAGLIVIDFIDMEEQKNNQLVEKSLKDNLKNDRSRMHMGTISSFGLLEMSRQRMKPSISEVTTMPCPHCHGRGRIKNDSSLAIELLRVIENQALKESQLIIEADIPVAIANYLSNHKRQFIQEMETRHNVSIVIKGVHALDVGEVEIRRIKRQTSNHEPLQEQIIDVDQPFRLADTSRGGEKRYDGWRRKGQRNAKNRVGHKSQIDPPSSDQGPKTHKKTGHDKRAKSKKKNLQNQSGPASAEAAKQPAESEDDQNRAAHGDTSKNGRHRSRSHSRRRYRKSQTETQSQNAGGSRNEAESPKKSDDVTQIEPQTAPFMASPPSQTTSENQPKSDANPRRRRRYKRKPKSPSSPVERAAVETTGTNPSEGD